MINLIGQILLGVPFVVFAYWYQQEEALFEATQDTATRSIVMQRLVSFIALASPFWA